MDQTIYRHSGGFSATGVVLVPAVGLPIAFVGAFLYQFLLELIPFLVVDIILACGFPLLLGFCCSKLAVVGRVRNLGLVLVLGILVGAAGWYFSWVALINMLTPRNFLIWDPRGLLLIAHELAEHGRWITDDDEPVSAWATSAMWCLEALLLCLGPALISWFQIDDKAYCEACDRWLDQETHVGPFFIPGNEDTTVERLKSGEKSPLFQLEPGSVVPGWRLKLRYCSGCEDLYLVNLMRLQTDEEGRLTEKKLVPNLIINRQEYDRLWSLDKPEGLGG